MIIIIKLILYGPIYYYNLYNVKEIILNWVIANSIISNTFDPLLKMKF